MGRGRGLREIILTQRILYKAWYETVQLFSMALNIFNQPYCYKAP